ncbi:OsmC family peroxiredoxin [Actinomycetaceae bacterium MB13-C1-2]|nr:OsmC family peroxiredoxin [Actinomycetaceae bacterium MB13-C1-2]
MTQETPTPKILSVNRIGTREYTATNSKGAELVIGDGEGQFTPGDLLKLAILGCNVLSSDARFARALGEDFELTGTVSAEYLESEDRFTEFFVELAPVLGDMYPEDRDRLLRRASGAIDRYCTISHTVTKSAPTSLTIDGEPQ